MKILGLIPARKGSVRIPDKNTKKLCGIPLIAYTIQAANESKHINRLIVSTDSEDISSIARKYGAETPFLRPADISQKDSTEIEFLEHTLKWLKDHEEYEPDLIVLLYPTSPCRKTATIDKAVEKINRHPEAHSLRSVKLCSEHPYKMWRMDNGLLTPFVKTQDRNCHTLPYHVLPEIYIQNASIYITRPSTIRNTKSPTGSVIIPFIMDENESVDINNPIDFLVAETIMKSTIKNETLLKA